MTPKDEKLEWWCKTCGTTLPLVMAVNAQWKNCITCKTPMSIRAKIDRTKGKLPPVEFEGEVLMLQSFCNFDTICPPSGQVGLKKDINSVLDKLKHAREERELANRKLLAAIMQCYACDDPSTIVRNVLEMLEQGE